MNFYKLLLPLFFTLLLLCGCSKETTKKSIHLNLDKDSNISYSVDDVANVDFLEDTGYQAYCIKYFMNDEFRGQDYLFFSNKDRILMQDIDSSIFCGDIDGDGSKEMVLAALEGSGVLTLYIYVLDVKDEEIIVSCKTGFGYKITQNFNDLTIRKCKVRENEIELTVEDSELKLVFDEKGEVKGEVDNHAVDVICVEQQRLDELMSSARDTCETRVSIE